MNIIKQYFKTKLFFILLILTISFLPKNYYNNLKDYYIIIKKEIIENKDIIDEDIYVVLKKIDEKLIEIDKNKK